MTFKYVGLYIIIKIQKAEAVTLSPGKLQHSEVHKSGRVNKGDLD